jgi:hypothetical protein
MQGIKMEKNPTASSAREPLYSCGGMTGWKLRGSGEKRIQSINESTPRQRSQRNTTGSIIVNMRRLTKIGRLNIARKIPNERLGFVELTTERIEIRSTNTTESGKQRRLKQTHSIS